jgi:hypothetical protein
LRDKKLTCIVTSGGEDGEELLIGSNAIAVNSHSQATRVRLTRIDQPANRRTLCVRVWQFPNLGANRFASYILHEPAIFLGRNWIVAVGLGNCFESIIDVLVIGSLPVPRANLK